MHRGTSPVVVLDGGLSNALADRGHDLTDELWTARLLRDAPAEIAAVHRAYFEAGAQVATTASYQASLGGLEHAGLTRADAERLIARSVMIAREVRDDVTASAGDSAVRLVAASVGPYGAVLADGSEYRGRYGLSRKELLAFHRPRIQELIAARPDALAVETIPDVDEAEAVLEVIRGSGVPTWLSYSIRGDRTCAGQPLAEAFAVAAGIPEVIAVGVNCCAPGDVSNAVTVARRVTGLPVVAYPNSGEQWDARKRSWSGDGTGFASVASDWVDRGARLVGGCCRTAPDAIALLAKTLTR